MSGFFNSCNMWVVLLDVLASGYRETIACAAHQFQY